MAEMNCVQLVERVTDYLEEALDDELMDAVDGHLRTCRACRSHVDQVLVVLKLLASLPAEQLSPAMEANLLAGYQR